MQEYHLILSGDAMPRWSTLRVDAQGAAWVDFKARSVPYDRGRPIARVMGDGPAATVEGVPEDVEWLEKSYAWERLLDPWSDQGWLAPDGKFWGCAFYAHDDIAYALLRKPPESLEWQGWIRVHADSYRGMAVREMTRRQERTLVALGFEPAAPVPGKGRRYGPDRSLPPPRFSVTPPSGIVPLQRRPVHAAEGRADAMERLHARLASVPEISEAMSGEVEFVAEMEGDWGWMFRLDGMDVGGEGHPAEAADAEGLRLVAKPWGDVEAFLMPFPGVVVESEAARLISRACRSPAACRA